jgi:hypothetical protein
LAATDWLTDTLFASNALLIWEEDMKFLNVSTMALLLMSASAQAANIERKIDMGAFKAVAVAGSTDAVITVGGAQSIVLRGPQKLVDATEVSLKDGVLLIKRSKASWGWDSGYKEGVTAHINAPTLNAYAVSGSGHATITGIKAAEFGIAISGSGNVKTAGQCQALTSTISGSGDIDAAGLHCSSAKVAVSGSGDAKVYASQAVTVSVAGSGDVTVLGKPAGSCTISVAGSGDVAVPGGSTCTSKIAGLGAVSY